MKNLYQVSELFKASQLHSPSFATAAKIADLASMHTKVSAALTAYSKVQKFAQPAFVSNFLDRKRQVSKISFIDFPPYGDINGSLKALQVGESLSKSLNSAVFETYSYLQRLATMDQFLKKELIRNYNFVDEEDTQTEALVKDEEKQVRRIITDIYRNNEVLYTIRPRDFEKMIAELLRSQGFIVELTKQTRDGGIDIIAMRRIGVFDFKMFVECKRFGKNKPVGVQIVRGFCDVITQSDINKGLLVTTSYFTADARKRTAQTPLSLELRDKHDVLAWVEAYLSNRGRLYLS